MKFFEIENLMPEEHHLGNLKKLQSTDGISTMYIGATELDTQFTSKPVSTLTPQEISLYFDTVGLENANMTANVYEPIVAAPSNVERKKT